MLGRPCGSPRSRALDKRLKPAFGTADNALVEPSQREQVLARYLVHSDRFDADARRRSGTGREVVSTLEIAPSFEQVEVLEQDPTGREVEVLQLISDGLVNREIGERLFVSEETVKSHVRHLLAKLFARSRAHAVAVGFRRKFIA